MDFHCTSSRAISRAGNCTATVSACSEFIVNLHVHLPTCPRACVHTYIVLSNGHRRHLAETEAKKKKKKKTTPMVVGHRGRLHQARSRPPRHSHILPSSPRATLRAGRAMPFIHFVCKVRSAEYEIAVDLSLSLPHARAMIMMMYLTHGFLYALSLAFTFLGSGRGLGESEGPSVLTSPRSWPT